ATYMIHVHPVDCSTSSVVESISCTKRTTAAEVVAKVTRKLGIENGLSYVLVEMHKDRGEEMILAQSDLPVQRMLLWPTQFQHSYKFVLRETDESGSVMYHGANSWHEKAERVSTERDMASKGFLPPSKLSDSDCPDLCAISSLSQNKILEILRKRFLKDKIYTYSADTLISINPYKFMPIYNPKYMTLYQNRRKEDLEPHIYAIADTAFNTMVQTKQNQCIVITGKSGSGKTQATHFLVHHSLALCQKSYMTGVENMLTGAGPVLEAFGNAQTEHNNNSSRFGKFLKIHFYGSGLLSGADVQTYLLEKSRLVHQEPNEKNFHIFYYLLYGTSPEELKEIYLDQNTNYNYLKQCSKHANTDAPAELERLRQAMEVMGFYIGAQRSIFRLIAAIILLGNITFKMKSGRDETLEIQDESYLTSVSLLLGLDKNVVRKCLLTRKAKAGAGERFVLSLKLEEARATRDAMSKALYQSLFDWAVSSVNMALAQKTRDTKLKSQSQWIGLLDIFGFEDFVKNSFEQFCINYASEHLQHYCIKHTFQLEQEEYRAEGLTWKEVDYADNSGCLLLYEKKITGLFHLIDENFPGANNHTLLSQFNRVHGNTRYYDTTVVKEDAFMIVHYAGKVKYQIKDFREKNHDQVREDLITLVRTSQSSFIQGIVSKSPAAVVRWGVLRAIVRAMFAFKNAGKKTLRKFFSYFFLPVTIFTSARIWQTFICRAGHNHLKKIFVFEATTNFKYKDIICVKPSRMARLSLHQTGVAQSLSGSESPRETSFYGRRKVNATSRGRKKTNSITQQYQASLSLLMSTLEQAHPFFVRCIQPNSKKVPLKVDEKLVLHQLRCSGLLQTIQLHQTRYPERMTGAAFATQFKLLLPQSNATLPEIKNFLLKIRLQPGTDFQIGKTQIFLRDHASRVLKESLHRVVLKHVILLQSRIRGYLARRSYCQQRAAAVQIQSYWRMSYRIKKKQRSNAALLIQRNYRGHRSRLLYRTLKLEKMDEQRQSWPIYSSASKKEQTIDDKSDETSPCMSPPNRTPQFNDTNNNHDISDKLKGTIDSPEPQATPPVDKTPFRARTKAGELFLKAAYPPNKIVVVKPVVYVPSSKRKQYDDETDYAKSYSLKPSVKTQDTGNFMYTTSPSKIDTEMEAAAPVQDKQAEKNTSDLKPTDHPLNGEIAETNYLTRAHSESGSPSSGWSNRGSSSISTGPVIPNKPNSVPTKVEKLVPDKKSETSKNEDLATTSQPTVPSFARSVSMERYYLNRGRQFYLKLNITTVTHSVALSKPRRQRSNSAIETYMASKVQPPSTDPVARKSASLSAEAFAKKCMQEQFLMFSSLQEKASIPQYAPLHDSDQETHHHQHTVNHLVLKCHIKYYACNITEDLTDGGKRGSAFIEAVRKTFWGSSRGQSRTHPTLAERKSNDSAISANDAVNIRSLEEEKFSPKLLVSSADVLLLLDDFIKSKTSSFNGEHLVDQVFKISLNEFCANLTALYSFATLSGDTNGLRYKDIVSNFRQVLEKTANHYSLDQYAAMMGVNGFRGYMNEFMNDVLPKYTAREAKSKRKKGKDDSEKLGHHFTGVQWGITQVCEFCNNVMWLMEAGLMCKICKFACHKKCFKQLTTRCPGSTEVDKLKSKPKKLFGESLASLASKESSVPTFIDKCISYMEMNGIYQEGIYRKSAAVAQNKLLEESLNKDIECQKVNFDDYNIHCVASCFKKFLRSLPSPLVPYDKYFEFLQAARITKEREKVNALYHVLEGIPRQNHATLERIVFHLARVAQQEPTNRMSPSNLAIVFTPCFFAAPPHVSPIEAAEQVGDMTKAVECVISEQVKKIRSTLESISEIQSAESSTNERLKQIRQS
uniref:Myosin motor domain-containing protein n=1 Tax=Ciona savignyi TaxID=51511 RepID=H2YUM5_CIOSA